MVGIEKTVGEMKAELAGLLVVRIFLRTAIPEDMFIAQKQPAAGAEPGVAVIFCDLQPRLVEEGIVPKQHRREMFGDDFILRRLQLEGGEPRILFRKTIHLLLQRIERGPDRVERPGPVIGTQFVDKLFVEHLLLLLFNIRRSRRRRSESVR